ncbi:MAG: hypothetical protein CM15mP83_4660 [Flavobacteriaceae bacterium]|nr:MAG: hypothetical protein CM15mP83_4660 [Flavobacteriaceae bacterium]
MKEVEESTKFSFHLVLSDQKCRNRTGVTLQFWINSRFHTRQDEGIDLLSQLASESEIRGVELNLSAYYKIDLSNRFRCNCTMHINLCRLESFNSRTISTFTSLGESA